MTFLDFGLVKRWTPGEWQQLAPSLDAIVVHRDPERLVAAMEDIGFLRPGHGLDPQRGVRLRQHAVPAVPHRHVHVHPRVRSRRAGNDHRRQRARTPTVIEKLNMPPSFVILDRVVWGVSAILGKLEVTAPWRAMLLEYRDGGRPATALGRGRAAWLAATNVRWRRSTLTSRAKRQRGTHVADPHKPRAPFAPWDRRELPGLFDVEESARRVGNYKWAEMKLFEALGGWVATVPELDVKMRLGTHCYKHAWHAELWHKRLPELREMNPDRLTQPANDAMVAVRRGDDRAGGCRT